MSTERVFQIERFLFGNLIQNNEPVGKPTILATSPGISTQQMQTALRLVRVRPPELEVTSKEMPSALGLCRVEELGYVILKAQRTVEGFPQLMYMLIPDMALRWLGGNYSDIEALGYQEMRSYPTQQTISPLTLDNPQTFTDEQQMDLIYDLFYYCGDDIKNVEAILAAIIHSQPVAILNAPPVLKERMGFIQGLLCLLPPPGRVGITWVTHTTSIDDLPTQINFVTSENGLDDVLVYDWAAGQVYGDAPQDKYSHFVTSQMRLDASLVVEVTTNIARTAVWRAMRKESLPQALHFASRRAAVDMAISNNQPADRETVAAILRQDPTLSEQMRIRYAQHLLAFTLALDDEPEYADVIPVVAATDRPVAESVWSQLRDAAQGPNSRQVFELINRWLNTIPQASVLPWDQLAQTAALTLVQNALEAGKTEVVVNFLNRIQGANRAMQMENIVPQIIDAVQSAAVYDNTLALTLLLLGAEYLPIEEFQRLVVDRQLVEQLPQRLQQAIRYLQPEPRPEPPPPNLLINVVSDLEAQERMLVVGRLAELAVQLRRDELLDPQVLEGLLRASQSGYAWRFQDLIQFLADRYAQPERLAELDEWTLSLLPHMYFSTGRSDVGIQLLEYYQNNLYGQQNLEEFTELIGEIFLAANLSIETLEQIFSRMEHSRLYPAPRTRAYAAVLLSSDWGLAYKNIARRLTLMLYNDPALVETITIGHTLSLLAFHARQKDDVSVMETGMALVEAAVAYDRRGVDLMITVWETLQPYPESRNAAYELLRQYIYLADASFAGHLPHYYGREVGAEVGRKLQGAYLFRQVLNGRELLQFAEALTITQLLLNDLASTYHESKELPPKHRLRRGLKSMTGGIDDEQRRRIGDNLERIARSIFMMSRQQPRGEEWHKREAELLKNRTAPRSPLDLLTFIGGRFAKHRRYHMEIEREAMTHVFGNRSVNILLDESTQVSNLFMDLLRALPPNKPSRVTLDAIITELNYLWKELSLYNQRQARPSLARDTQATAQIVLHIGRQTAKRVFDDQKLIRGASLPKNEIEALMWISGYFHRRHPE